MTLPPPSSTLLRYSPLFLFPSVRQPPLPLQESLPLQPLSLALQPPLPLQEFWPLQACFSLTFLSSAFLSWLASLSCALREAFSEGSRVEALTAAPVPATNPANAAPASKAFVVFVIFQSFRPFRMRRGTTSGQLFHLRGWGSPRGSNRPSLLCV